MFKNVSTRVLRQANLKKNIIKKVYVERKMLILSLSYQI